MNNEAAYLEALQAFIADCPGNLACIAMFLQNYRPLLPPAESGDNMTSLEIADALEDICSIETTQVAYVMTKLGYRLHSNAYNGLEWAMMAVAHD